MRLLSFLTDIERAIRVEANADEGSIWNTTRIVNFKTGLARLTLTSREAESGFPAGGVLVQHYALANGSFCVKASLTWEGCEGSSIVSVYETPTLNWKLEASRIATAWLAGPASITGIELTSAGHEERVAVAG